MLGVVMNAYRYTAILALLFSTSSFGAVVSFSDNIPANHLVTGYLKGEFNVHNQIRAYDITQINRAYITFNVVDDNDPMNVVSVTPLGSQYEKNEVVPTSHNGFTQFYDDNTYYTLHYDNDWATESEYFEINVANDYPFTSGYPVTYRHYSSEETLGEYTRTLDDAYCTQWGLLWCLEYTSYYEHQRLKLYNEYQDNSFHDMLYTRTLSNYELRVLHSYGDMPYEFLDVSGDFILVDATLHLDVSNIPVPAAAWLFASGLTGLVSAARCH